VIIDELELDDRIFPAKLARSTVRQRDMPDERIILDRIEEILSEAENVRHPTQPFPPRIRLKINYSGKWLNIPPINGRRFGAQYANRIANASEMISVRSKRDESKKKAHEGDGLLTQKADETKTVDELVEKYFSHCPTHDKLIVLSEVEMSRSMQEYSNVETTFTAADKFLNENIHEQINKRAEKLKKKFSMGMENIEGDNFEDQIERFCRQELSFKAEQDTQNISTQNLLASVGDFDSP